MMWAEPLDINDVIQFLIEAREKHGCYYVYVDCHRNAGEAVSVKALNAVIDTEIKEWAQPIAVLIPRDIGG